MKRKFIRKSLIGFIAAVMITNIYNPINARAEKIHFSTKFCRGFPYVSYIEAKVDWVTKTTKKTIKISKSSGRQKRNGIAVQNLLGIPRVKKTKKTHVYHSSFELIAGIKVGGTTFGYAVSITDKITVRANGKKSVKKNI